MLDKMDMGYGFFMVNCKKKKWIKDIYLIIDFILFLYVNILVML